MQHYLDYNLALNQPVSQSADLILPSGSHRHDGPIHGLSWAHPSFGSILASCSFDGKVFIWKENEGPQKGWSKVKEHLLHTASGQSRIPGHVPLVVIPYSSHFSYTVNAIAWAPHELGPVLACASSDGKVSVLTFNS